MDIVNFSSAVMGSEFRILSITLFVGLSMWSANQFSNVFESFLPSCMEIV